MTGETPELPNREMQPEPMAAATDASPRSGGLIMLMTALLATALVAGLMMLQSRDTGGGGDAVALDAASQTAGEPAVESDPLPSIKPISADPASEGAPDADDVTVDEAGAESIVDADSDSDSGSGSESDSAAEDELVAEESPQELACVAPMVPVDGECQKFTLSFPTATATETATVTATKVPVQSRPAATKVPVQSRPVATAVPVQVEPTVGAVAPVSDANESDSSDDAESPVAPPASDLGNGSLDDTVDEPVQPGDTDSYNSVDPPNVQCVRAPCCVISAGAADEPAVWCDGRLCDPSSPHAGCDSIDPPAEVVPPLLEPGGEPEGMQCAAIGLPPGSDMTEYCDGVPDGMRVCTNGQLIPEAADCASAAPPATPLPEPIRPPLPEPTYVEVTCAAPNPDCYPCLAVNPFCLIDCATVNAVPGSDLFDYCSPVGQPPEPDPEEKTCPGDVVVPVGASCPVPHPSAICPDGTVSFSGACPAPNPANTCPDGSPIPAGAPCPEVAPPTPTPDLIPPTPLPPTPIPPTATPPILPPPANCPAGSNWNGSSCALVADPYCSIATDAAGNPIVREDDGEYLIACA